MSNVLHVVYMEGMSYCDGLETALNRIRVVVECAFCKTSLRDPVLTRCKHGFCGPCIADALKKHLPCPTCKARMKSRSLKKSLRLQTLVPLVHKLITQTQQIAETSKKVRDVGTENITSSIDSVDEDLQTSCNKLMEHKSTSASINETPHLWGRLLTASRSSSSHESEEPPERRNLLNNDPAILTVKAKVTDWLKSSVPNQPSSGDIPSEPSDFSEDLISASLVSEKQLDGKDLDKPNNTVIVNGFASPAKNADKFSVFPKRKPLKTFSSSKKFNYASRGPQPLQLSQDLSDTSETRSNNLNEANYDNPNASAMIISTDTVHNSETVTQLSALPEVESQTNINSKNRSGAGVIEPVCNDSSESPVINESSTAQCSLYNRKTIIDKNSVTACGYVDIHNHYEDSNIVLKHLENAIAGFPRGTSYIGWNSTEQSGCKLPNSQPGGAVIKRSIVHSSTDIISAIPDSQLSGAAPKKRSSQASARGRPRKIRKHDKTDSNNEKCSINTEKEIVSHVHKRNGLHQNFESRASTVSETALQEIDPPLTNSTNRSCVSDGNLTALRATYSASKPENWPKALTKAFVKMVRLENPVEREVDEPRAEALDQQSQINPSQGRTVNIDLNKAQEWEQGDEADDIICCSWNEPKKVNGCNESWHENCSDPNSQQESRMDTDFTNDIGDSVKCTNQTTSNFLKSKSLRLPQNSLLNGKLIDQVFAALQAVSAIDRDYVLKHFPGSSNIICAAMDSCRLAITAFEEEVLTKSQKIDTVTSLKSNNSPSSAKDFKKQSAGDSLINGSVHETNCPVHKTNDNRLGSKANVDVPSESTSRQPTQIDDNYVENSPIQNGTPCDDLVTAKVESWLNKLGELNEKDHCTIPSPRSNQQSVSNSNRQATPEVSLDENLLENVSGLSQKSKTGPVLGLGTTSVSLERVDMLLLRNKAMSQASTPCTHRSIFSHVDPDPPLEGDHQSLINGKKCFEDSLECDNSELAAITASVSNNNAKAPQVESGKNKSPDDNLNVSSKEDNKTHENILDQKGKTKLSGYRIPRKAHRGRVLNCSQDTAKIGFVTSGLQEHDVKSVKLFANRYGGKRYDSFLHDKITHVIMKSTSKRACDRTLKYLLGIACKKWIVSMKWVTDSLRAGKKLPEGDYEIVGDNCMKEFESDSPDPPRGPTKSRISSAEYKLFDKYSCLCVPPFSLITVENASLLLQYCGATVAKSFEEFKATMTTRNGFQNRLVIVDAEFANDFPSYSSIEDEYNAIVIGIEWVYESISRFKPQPLDNFYLSAFTQDSNRY